MKTKVVVLFGVWALCAPALASYGANLADSLFGFIPEVIAEQKQIDQGEAVRVSFSATRQVLGEVDIVTAHTSGFALVPEAGQTTVVYFEKDGLLLDIQVLRDHRNIPSIVFDGKSSVLDPSCVLSTNGECRKALAKYQVHEQLLLSSGVSNIKLGDYSLTINVEGQVAK